MHLGTLDDATQLQPTYELWTSRRERWLRPFAGAIQYKRDRDINDTDAG